MSELPVDDYNEWDNYIGPNGRPRIDITPPAPPLDIRRSAKGNTWVAQPEAPATPYTMAPDLLETQQGQQSLPAGYALNDAGIPFNLNTGAELPTVRRPNVLPIAMTPDGPTLAMPKMLDLASNIMGGIGAPAVATKAGEVVLGSGALKTAMEAPNAVQPFYSALEQAVNNSKVGKASPEQWLGYLKNQPGVKSEELSTVLGDIPQGPITKSEMQGIVQNNKVQLGEKIRQSVNEDSPEFKSLTNKIMSEEKHNSGRNLGLAEAQDMAYERLSGAGETKYHGYQLSGSEPGSYKEMLLTLPDKVKAAETELKSAIGDGIPWGKGKLYSDEIIRGLAKEDLGVGDLPKEIQGTAQKFLDIYKNNNNFKSSHWDEPNIIAHVRMNDRNVEGKKVLHLEEIQSDWHQKGRNEGYKLSDKQKQDLDNIEGKLTNNLTEAEIGNPDIDNVLKVAVDKKVITPDEAKNYKDYIKGENSTVPDAPFKKNWDELALKRMLHKAATEGYEGLSWTPGEAQAARYDLSKQVDHIKVEGVTEAPGVNFVDIKPKSGAEINLEVENGIVREGEYKGKPLADVVGKEMAEKITSVKSGHKEFTGDNLKIGGEGMKSFYDKMLVDKANALAKKYGSKVESMEISSSDRKYKYEGPKYDFDSLRKFKADNKNNLTASYDKQILDIRNEINKGSTFEDAIAHYGSVGLAEKLGGKLEEIVTKQPIHYLPITPELRAKAKSGFPLFSSSPTLTVVSHDPFDNDKQKKYRLTPVQGNPFDPKANATAIEAHRSNGGRADLNRPVSPGPAPSYGIRPPIMDQQLPEFEQFQPNSLE